MIEKRLCTDYSGWQKLVNEFEDACVKIYHNGLPDFPFIALYDSRQERMTMSFVTMDDFM